jgi:hypothetical protein
MMPGLASCLLFAARINDLWYAVPLIVVVSLVYSATRHELAGSIVNGATRMAAWICGFMLIGFVLLFAISSML